MSRLQELNSVLERASDSEKAKNLAGFFKTGKGEYGEGDIFMGIQVPKQREIAREFSDLSFSELQELLNSNIHEKRLLALIILVERYKKSNKQKQEGEKRKIFDFYLKNSKNINNWDLVDLSAPKITGEYLINQDRSILYKLAKSDLIWERRIAVLSCFAFIREKDFKDSIRISESLLNDKHDLIHKAVGWMLREIGKRDENKLLAFLNRHCSRMPRTMLRYAVEKLSEDERGEYMGK